MSSPEAPESPAITPSAGAKSSATYWFSRRFQTLALCLLTLSWLFPPWKEKIDPIGLHFVLAPPERGVRVDYGRLLLLDAILLVGALGLSRVRRRHVVGTAKLGLAVTGGLAIAVLIGWIIESKNEAARELRRQQRAERVLTDEEAIRLLDLPANDEMSAEEFMRGLDAD